VATPSITDLRREIKLVLSQVNPSEPIYTLRALKLFGPSSPEDLGDSPFIVTDPREIDVINEQVGLLKMLYGKCSQRLKPSFPVLLLKEIAESNAEVIVVTLVHTGHLRQLLGAFRGGAFTPRLRRKMWQAIRGMLSFEPHRFTGDDLTRVEKIRKENVKWASDLEKFVKRRLPPPQLPRSSTKSFL
jgi:hypothetical protein